jgi:hypothetical protein
LPRIPENHGIIVDLIIKLLRGASFTDCLSFTTPQNLIEALNSPLPSINILAITLLGKASSEPANVGIVAGLRDLVSALIHTWLQTSDTEVTEKAARVLKEFFIADGSPHGQKLFWRRVFTDKDIYEILFSACSIKSTSDCRTSREKTLSQSRLLDMLPTLATINMDLLTQSHHPDIEKKYGLKNEGLLDFAAVHMVDFKDDILMAMSLIDFYTALLKVEPEPASFSLDKAAQRSKSLGFLVSRGLHKKAMSYYIDQDSPTMNPLDVILLSARSANYLSAYAADHPAHLLAASAPGGSSLVSKILSQIQVSLETPAARRLSSIPVHALHLLTSLPRVAIIPNPQDNTPSSRGSAWQASPLSSIATTPINPDYLNTLAALFQSSPRISKQEAEAAHAIYTIYISQQPEFFRSLIKAAEVIALKDTALAAINVITSIVTAKGATQATRSTSNTTLPTLETLEAWASASLIPVPPPSGALALLHPPAVDAVIPYLISPAQTFSNLVGGRGDVESAAYKVGMAKFDALVKLSQSLKEVSVGGQELDVGELRKALDARIAKGPWATGSAVGGRIATMDL